MNTIKDLVALLQTIPEDAPLPDVDTDKDGDLKLEWYFTKYNVVQLTAPTDGAKPYIVKYIKGAEEDGTIAKGVVYDLSKLPFIINTSFSLESKD